MKIKETYSPKLHVQYFYEHLRQGADTGSERAMEGLNSHILLVF